MGKSVAARERDISLLELLDRILDKGVIISGDITISVADVDLIFLGLKVLLSSVETAERLRRANRVAPVAYRSSQVVDDSGNGQQAISDTL
jgi:hypothetical protein